MYLYQVEFWKSIFFLYYKLSLALGNFNCDDAYSCASISINITTFESISINCYGYKSCYESSLIGSYNGDSFDHDTQIGCSGSYSCADSKIIQASTLLCRGLNSCNSIHAQDTINSDSELWCSGEQSCTNSTFFMASASTIKCQGYLSCADSIFVFDSASVDVIGYYGGYNSTFISAGGSSVQFWGSHSGYHATVICGLDHICSIDCDGGYACDYVALLCGNETDQYTNGCQFDVDCSKTSKNYLCPGGHENWAYFYDNNVNYNNTYGIRRYNNDNSNNNSNIMQCDDYYQCISGFTILNKSLVCRGTSSCIFDDIVFDIANVRDNYQYNQENNEFVSLTCDGSSSCENIANLIYFNDTSSTSSKLTKNISISNYFRGYNAAENSNLKIVNNIKNNGNSINIECNGEKSCQGLTLSNVNNIYCCGSQSCWQTKMINIKGNVWFLLDLV